jgi:hypothetical protein
MLPTILEALTALGLATGVARNSVVYAIVSAGHVLGIALLVGPILLADLRLAGLLASLDAPALRILRRTARVGIVLALGTGIVLLSARPADYAANWVVRTKLAVVAVAIANALVFEFRALRVGLPAMLGGGARTAAILSIALWLSALVLGRWIAFV